VGDIGVHDHYFWTEMLEIQALLSTNGDLAIEDRHFGLANRARRG
jgi:hypothetical protein